MGFHSGGLRNGLLASGLLAVLVHLGSRKLLYFDAALMPYLLASLFCLMGVVYRYTVWLDRPPTRLLWKRSVSPLRFTRAQIVGTARIFFQHVVIQRFIQKRGFYRWLMHFSLAWGTMLAFAVTFPLVFGWLHFATAPGDPQLYQLYALGFPQLIFHPDGIIGFLFFNALNFASLMVILGTIMAFTRRILHSDLVPNQSFVNDFLPLLILFSVAITGLFLTFSTRFLGGEHYRVLSTVHCFTVVVFLVYLPFGKFFHIFQRGAQLGASIYIRERKSGTKDACPKCGTAFTSRMQAEDVRQSLRETGFIYTSGSDEISVQDLCPPCRRKLLMWGQHCQLEGQFDAAHTTKAGIHG